MADNTDGLQEDGQLQKIKDWEKKHGYKYPDHAHDVRTLLRIIEHLNDRDLAFIPAAAHLHGMADRVEDATDKCEGVLANIENIVVAVRTDISMFNRIAARLITNKPVTLAQLTAEERQWVKSIPERLKNER